MLIKTPEQEKFSKELQERAESACMFDSMRPGSTPYGDIQYICGFKRGYLQAKAEFQDTRKKLPKFFFFRWWIRSRGKDMDHKWNGRMSWRTIKYRNIFYTTEP